MSIILCCYYSSVVIITNLNEQDYHILILDFNAQSKVKTVRPFFRIVVQNLHLFSEFIVEGVTSEVRTANDVAF